jgi:thiosulfate reductase cytochrome b subunit
VDVANDLNFSLRLAILERHYHNSVFLRRYQALQKVDYDSVMIACIIE